ncbi:outer membrane lipoprotein-sorting protein [Fodinicurvata sp. EGI_FJ10296]|uniref:outer membrane lipoprotein-sorting protein n=1 Tax=Fodinicurvata sp. EGI_FJ10296 TaxID=3231908 RepID=UPI003452B53E
MTDISGQNRSPFSPRAENRAGAGAGAGAGAAAAGGTALRTLAALMLAPALAVLSVPGKSSADSGLPDPNVILEEVDEIRAPDTDFVFSLEVESRSDDEVDTSALRVRVKDSEKSLVVFSDPPDQAGRVLLSVEDNMWIYIPGTSRPIRISPQQRLSGTVANADVSRVVYSLDYDATAIEADTVDGVDAWRLSLERDSDFAAYGSLTLWVRQDNSHPIKAEFFALSGRLLNTAYYGEYEELLGRERPTVLEVHSAVNTGEVTTMRYYDMAVEVTPDQYFQRSFMTRVR